MAAPERLRERVIAALMAAPRLCGDPPCDRRSCKSMHLDDFGAMADAVLALIPVASTNAPDAPSSPESALADEVIGELVKARAKHAPMHSLHEGYAVIAEEVDEFWDEVRAWQPGNFSGLAKARKELIQVAAMAMRCVLDVIEAASSRPTH